jgi:hypothetical protein
MNASSGVVANMFSIYADAADCSLYGFIDILSIIDKLCQFSLTILLEQNASDKRKIIFHLIT